MEKKGEQYAKIANKGKTGRVFLKRWPSIASPLGDGPFTVLRIINNDAYILDMPQEYGGSTTFNTADLSPFISSMDNLNLRTKPFQEGESDVNLG
ncbi:hypothetical protein CR513_42296, partial [Mucuna pruriens]